MESDWSLGHTDGFASVGFYLVLRQRCARMPSTLCALRRDEVLLDTCQRAPLALLHRALPSAAEHSMSASAMMSSVVDAVVPASHVGFDCE